MTTNWLYIESVSALHTNIEWILFSVRTDEYIRKCTIKIRLYTLSFIKVVCNIIVGKSVLSKKKRIILLQTEGLSCFQHF